MGSALAIRDDIDAAELRRLARVEGTALEWQALLVFRETYNTRWLIQRHGFRPPAAIRQDQLPTPALAA